MNEDRILDKLDGIDAQNRLMIIALTRLEEQVRTVPDHEERIRSLERWKYGLPVTGMTSVLAMALSIWTQTKGGV